MSERSAQQCPQPVTSLHQVGRHLLTTVRANCRHSFAPVRSLFGHSAFVLILGLQKINLSLSSVSGVYECEAYIQALFVNGCTHRISFHSVCQGRNIIICSLTHHFFVSQFRFILQVERQGKANKLTTPRTALSFQR